MLRRVPVPALAIGALGAAIGAWALLRAGSTSTEPAASAEPAASVEPASSAEPAASAEPASSAEPATSAEPASSAEPTTSAEPGAGPGVEGTLARVAKSEPSGVHVALDARLVVQFDRPPPQDRLTITIEPPAQGKRAWQDPQTLVFEPERWAPGKAIHVKLQGAGVETTALKFVTLAPPPARVEPGRGERLTLTFDDGAKDPAQVTALLDLLQKEKVQAIFFPTGYWADTHPRLVERMWRDGHRVCNHTYSHPDLRQPRLSDDAIRKEISKGAGAGKCQLFRPPMRATDARVERIVAEMGYTMYLWDVDSRDWEGLPAEDMVHRVLARVKPGSVVLFHMHGAAMLQAVTALIPRLRKAGYALRDEASTPAP